MKRTLCICGAIGSALLMAGPASAQWTVLQVVDLTELGMSAEGGEATLYRLPYSLDAACKIEVIHFGEEGKRISVFEFGRKLAAAESREYRYKVPLSVDAKAKPILTAKITSASPKGRDALSKEFETYKALFDPEQLAKCSGR